MIDFWAERQKVNDSATIGHCHDWMERQGWVGNFRAATDGRLPQDRNGAVFTDSDVYKLMEARRDDLGRGSTECVSGSGDVIYQGDPKVSDDVCGLGIVKSG